MENVKQLERERDKWKHAAETRHALLAAWGRILGYTGTNFTNILLCIFGDLHNAPAT